ncbi:MAG TPA: hypothetical protein VNK82_12745 [Terriglobales bacterium]|nr:hypothetical protein [Terriglobales bacterium]
MTTPSLSAVDAVTPAFDHARRALLQPFRFALWWRLSLVGLLSGEFVSGGGGGGTNWQVPAQRRGNEDLIGYFAEPDFSRIMEFLPLILFLVAVLIVLGIVMLYISSVFRFILLETVLHDRCEIGAGWNRWQRQGWSYFLWQLGFNLAVLLMMGLVVGLALAVAAATGALSAPREHVALLVAGGVVLFFVLMAMLLVNLVIWLFTKDFVVPMMALDDVGAVEGWRRLLPLLSADKGGYAVYVIMKAILAVGAALVFGIAQLIVTLILLVPVGLVAAGAILGGKAAGLTWNAATIALAVVVGTVLLLLLIWLWALISVPAVFFFQSYTLRFFGGRYARLGALMGPVPPPIPVVPAAGV